MGLMASDNFDSDMVMAEDELSLIARIQESLVQVRPLPGVPHDQAVLNHVLRYCSGSFDRKEMVKLMNFGKTCSPESVQFLRNFQRFICDPSKFSVLPSFFGKLSELPPHHNILKVALCVWMYAADRSKPQEIQTVKGKINACVVKDAHLKKIHHLEKQLSMEANKILTWILNQYWVAPMKEGLQIRAEILLKSIGGFLRKVAKFMTSNNNPISKKEFEETLAGYERMMRKSLEGSCRLPPAVCVVSIADVADTKIETDMMDMSLRAVPQLSFKGLEIVQNARAKAAELGFKEGMHVTLAQAVGELEQGANCVIRGFEARGVSVQREGEQVNTDFICPVSSLLKKQVSKVKGEKRKAEEAGLTVPEGFPFKLASVEQSVEVLRSMVVVALYKAYTGAATGSAELCLQWEPRRIFAGITFKENQLVFVPFSTDIRTSKPSEYESVVVQVHVNFGGCAESHTFYAREWGDHRARTSADSLVPEAIAPYWFVRHAENSKQCVQLVHRDVSIECPFTWNPATGESVLKRSATKLPVTITFPVLTNAVLLLKGTQLAAAK